MSDAIDELSRALQNPDLTPEQRAQMMRAMEQLVARERQSAAQPEGVIASGAEADRIAADLEAKAQTEGSGVVDIPIQPPDNQIARQGGAPLAEQLERQNPQGTPRYRVKNPLAVETVPRDTARLNRVPGLAYREDAGISQETVGKPVDPNPDKQNVGVLYKGDATKSLGTNWTQDSAAALNIMPFGVPFASDIAENATTPQTYISWLSGYAQGAKELGQEARKIWNAITFDEGERMLLEALYNEQRMAYDQTWQEPEAAIGKVTGYASGLSGLGPKASWVAGRGLAAQAGIYGLVGAGAGSLLPAWQPKQTMENMVEVGVASATGATVINIMRRWLGLSPKRRPGKMREEWEKNWGMSAADDITTRYSKRGGKIVKGLRKIQKGAEKEITAAYDKVKALPEANNPIAPPRTQDALSDLIDDFSFSSGKPDTLTRMLNRKFPSLFEMTDDGYLIFAKQPTGRQLSDMAKLANRLYPKASDVGGQRAIRHFTNSIWNDVKQANEVIETPFYKAWKEANDLAIANFKLTGLEAGIVNKLKTNKRYDTYELGEMMAGVRKAKLSELEAINKYLDRYESVHPKGVAMVRNNMAKMTQEWLMDAFLVKETGQLPVTLRETKAVINELARRIGPEGIGTPKLIQLVGKERADFLLGQLKQLQGANKIGPLKAIIGDTLAQSAVPIVSGVGERVLTAGSASYTVPYIDDVTKAGVAAHLGYPKPGTWGPHGGVPSSNIRTVTSPTSPGPFVDEVKPDSVVSLRPRVSGGPGRVDKNYGLSPLQAGLRDLSESGSFIGKNYQIINSERDGSLYSQRVPSLGDRRRGLFIGK